MVTVVEEEGISPSNKFGPWWAVLFLLQGETVYLDILQKNSSVMEAINRNG